MRRRLKQLSSNFNVSINQVKKELVQLSGETTLGTVNLFYITKFSVQYFLGTKVRKLRMRSGNTLGWTPFRTSRVNSSAFRCNI